MISVERILPHLLPSGFHPVWIDHEFGSFRFGRPSPIPEIFEQIWINTQGKKCEAVSARAVVSVENTNTATKGLFEDEYLAELDTHEFRAYSLVESKAAAMAWELHLGRIASNAAMRVAGKHGTGLLQRTGAIRLLVERYIASAAPYHSIFDLETFLKKASTSTQQKAALRLQCNGPA